MLWKRRRSREPSWIDVYNDMPLHVESTEDERAEVTAFVLAYEARKHLVASAPIKFVDASSGTVFATSAPAFSPSDEDRKELELLLAELGTHQSTRKTHHRPQRHYWGVRIKAGELGCWWIFKGVAELRHSDGGSLWFCDPHRRVEKWVVDAAVRYGFSDEAKQMGAPWV